MVSPCADAVHLSRHTHIPGVAKRFARVKYIRPAKMVQALMPTGDLSGRERLINGQHIKD
jgi:hypothetical protein